MAALRNRTQVTVGSKQWVFNERDQVTRFEEQEVEDFAFSTRNEVEWLNEHMAEIFSNNQLNVTEIFKTPGKLRGKTPRTVRKKNPQEARAPLTEIFATDRRYNSPLRGNVVRDPKKTQPFSPDAFALGEPSRNALKHTKLNTGLRYQGSTEDEMEVDNLPNKNNEEPIVPADDAMEVDADQEQEPANKKPSEGRRTTEGSFHSARENLTTGVSKDPRISSSSPNTLPGSFPGESILPSTQPTDIEMLDDKNYHSAEKDSVLGIDDQDLDGSHVSSQSLSPAQPLVRKSSLTFASLPAREPLTTKKSIGAQVSRTSNVEAPRTSVLNRGSYFGRFTGGKSIGATRQLEEDQMDVDENNGPMLNREESDGDGKMMKLHNKASTQRLHERITMLGKSQPPRPTKSISAVAVPAQPTYPTLPKLDADELASKEVESSEVRTLPVTSIEDDDDDWIVPLAPNSPEPSRPQLPKSRSVDVMEQISGKDSISGMQFEMGAFEKEQALQKSPLRTHVERDQSEPPQFPEKAASVIAMESSMQAQENGHKKAISVSGPSFPLQASTTPIDSPSSKFHLDGHLSASKSKLQSIMKSARGLFSSSARVSTKAKLETMSPSAVKARGQGQAPHLSGIMENTKSTSFLRKRISPPLHETESMVTESPSKVRRTRSSTEKEEKRRQKEARDLQVAEAEFAKAREKERTKAAKFKEKADAATAVTSAAPTNQPKDLPTTRQVSQTTRPVRQSPRRQQNQNDKQAGGALAEQAAQAAMPPPARPRVTSAQQKGKEPRRPIKPAKETLPKPKPQPVSIRVGTLSQRIPLTNAALSSSLQESLGPSQPKTNPPTKKASTASIQTSASTTSFKSSVSSMTSKPKALIAAERKREQDEKEAQRKLENKREIERKRAAAQEEAQKRELERKRALEEAQKRENERRRLAAQEEAQKRENERKGALALEEAQKREVQLQHEARRQQEREAQDKRQRLLEKQGVEKQAVGGNRLEQQSHRQEAAVRPPSAREKPHEFMRGPLTQPIQNSVKPKRVFDPDQDDELVRPARAQPGQNYQQNEGKRRRTGDEDTFEPPTRPTMAPPIRYSNIRKEAPKSSVFGTNYPIAPPPAKMHAASQKPPMMNQPYALPQYGGQGPRAPSAMDMSKYTNGKIPFAEAPNPPQGSSYPQQGIYASQGAYRTPLPSKGGMPPPPPRSPMFSNGDNIHLDEIQTSDEEEDSEDERTRKQEKNQHLPDWVRTPNMHDILRRQELVDPGQVFGAVMPAPNVEEWFPKDKNRLNKLRARTSSANWFGSDRLTEEEIRRDNAAREKMSRDGGWTYGL